jgi:hypothetical protein
MRKKTRRILEDGAARAATNSTPTGYAANPVLPDSGPPPKKPAKAKGGPIKHGAPLANAIAALIEEALSGGDESVLDTQYLEMLKTVLDEVEPWMGQETDDEDDDATTEGRVPTDVASFLRRLEEAGRGGRRSGAWLY